MGNYLEENGYSFEARQWNNQGATILQMLVKIENNWKFLS
jgi:hypothetical protein